MNHSSLPCVTFALEMHREGEWSLNENDSLNVFVFIVAAATYFSCKIGQLYGSDVLNILPFCVFVINGGL